MIWHNPTRAIFEEGKGQPKNKKEKINISKLYSDLLKICDCEAEKSVCAKIITGGETIA